MLGGWYSSTLVVQEFHRSFVGGPSSCFQPRRTDVSDRALREATTLASLDALLRARALVDAPLQRLPAAGKTRDATTPLAAKATASGRSAAARQERSRLGSARRDRAREIPARLIVRAVAADSAQGGRHD